MKEETKTRAQQEVRPTKTNHSIEHVNESLQWKHPDAKYSYFDKHGNFIGEIHRWNATESRGKTIRPYSGGKYQNFHTPYPLYNLPGIIENPGKAVLFVEGEKCAEVAKKAFPQMIVTTTPFGANSADKCDFSSLKGRDVFIMRDFDFAGYGYMNKICALCIEAEAHCVSELPIEEFAKWGVVNGKLEKQSNILKSGYDIADAVNDGFDQDSLISIFAKYISEKIPMDTWSIPDLSGIRRDNIVVNYKSILPNGLFDILNDINLACECSFEQVLLNLLVYSSNLIGNRRSIREEGAYIQPIHLWGMQIGESGQGKSNSMKPFKEAINPLIKRRYDEYKEKMQTYIATIAEYEKQKKNKDSCIDYNISALKKPILRRITTQNATSEAIIKAIDTENPDCILYAKDEVSGILLGVERFQKGDYTLLLEAYDGIKNYQHDRVGNGDKEPICIKVLSIGILGGIQPDVFKELLGEKNRANDGLLPRFLFVIARPLKSYPDRNRHQYDIEKLKAIFENLDKLSLDNKIISFSEEAIIAYNVWRKDHRNRDQKYATGMLASFYARMDGQLIRIAGVLEYLKYVSAGCLKESEEISKESVLGACQLIDDLFKPMARELLGGYSKGARIDNIVNFLRYAKESQLMEFRKSEMDRYKYPFKLTNNEVKFLIDEDIIKQKQHAKGIGRPSVDYLVNPHIKEITEI